MRRGMICGGSGSRGSAMAATWTWVRHSRRRTHLKPGTVWVRFRGRDSIPLNTRMTNMPVKNRFAELQTEITAWRRDLHENPEILFETHRTSALVADRLKEFGCDEIVTGIGRTGVVGVIRSKTDGAMHACGHDGHTAMLLGAAKYLSETRNFDGTVVVIFQPAEEGGGGGKEMCDDGMMDRWGIQEVYGMHNWPGRPVGSFAIRPGAFFAATDQFDIT